jgi:DNA polymerase V|tara:strand:- start:57539 stop:58792 length:1254 start_codon:yes stop_codon:yes gene_type:complete
MFALTDVSGAYSSMEKVFDPSIRNRPVIVLSNNDAAVVALCPIAKRLGIQKFEPYYKIKWMVEKHNVVVRSSNYALYANISEKMMNVISSFCDKTYIYSIDEAFSHFKNYDGVIDDWYSFGHKMRRKIWIHTKMPVGIGLGHTLTLAKAASFGSRKVPGADGVAVIDSELARKTLLGQMSTNDIWGVGGKTSKKLSKLGIDSGWDLACQNPKTMRQNFGVTMERTVNELNGIPCLKWEDVPAPKKQIYSTRSFGQRVFCYHDLRKALMSHAATVCRKVIQQQSLVKSLYVFAANSPYDERYIKKGLVFDFPTPTDNIMRFSAAISLLVDHLFVENVGFYRCGVGAIELCSKKYLQADLFEVNDNPALMNCYAEINNKFGKSTLQLASEPREEKWAMRREFMSPQYTTKWSDIPKIQC